MTLHFLANIATNLLTQLGLIYLLDGFAKPRFAFKGRSVAYAALLSFVLGFDTYFIDTQYRFIVNILIYAAAIFAYYKAGIMRLSLLWLLNIALTIAGEAASMPMLWAMGWDPRTYTLTSWWLPVVNITLAAVYWTEILLIRSVASAGKDRIDKKTWAMIGYCAFAAVFASVYIFVNSETLYYFISSTTRGGTFFSAATSPAAAVLTVALLMGLLFMIFSVIRRMNGALQKAQAAKQVAEEADLAAKQAREAKEKLETVAKIRHDMKGHLLAIDALGQSGQSDRQKRYIEELIKSLGLYRAAELCGMALEESERT